MCEGIPKWNFLSKWLEIKTKLIGSFDGRIQKAWPLMPNEKVLGCPSTFWID